MTGQEPAQIVASHVCRVKWSIPLPLPSRRMGGRLACLDVAAPVLQPLLMPGLEVPRTVLESDLGQPLADVHYFAELGPGRKSAERVFVCLPGGD